MNINRNLYKKINKLYVSLFIFLIVGCLIAFGTVHMGQLIDTTKELDHELLDQITNNIELRLQKIDSEVVNYIETDKMLKRYMQGRAASDNDYYSMVIDIQSKINTMKTVHESIDSIYIYSNINERIITDTSIENKKDFHDIPFIDDISTRSGYYLLKMGRYIEETGKNVITFVRPYPGKRSSGLEGFIVINIDEALLYDVIKGITGVERGNIEIIDEEGRILSSVDKTKIGTQSPIAEEVDENDSQEIVMDRSHVFYRISAYTHWIYACIVDNRVFYGTVKSTVGISLVVTVFMIILSILINHFLGKVTYKPLYELVHNIVKNMKKEQSGSDISYSEIDEEIKAVFSGREKLQLYIKESIPAVKYKLILEILLGKKLENLKVYFDIIGESLHKENFIVFITRLDKNFSSGSNEEYLVNKLNTEYIIDKYIRETGCGITSEIKDDLVTVVSFEGGDAKKNIASVLEVANRISSEMEANYECSVSIAIGGFYSDEKDIRASYQEAAEAMKYSLILGKNSIIFIDDVRSNGAKQSGVYKANLSNLSVGVAARNIEKVREALDEIYNEMIAEKLSQNAVYRISIEIITHVVEEITKMGVTAAELLGSDYNEYYNIGEVLENFTSIEDIRIFVKNVLDCFMDILDSKKIEKNRSEALMDEILSRINEKFHESDFSLSSLAEEFKLSTAYVSALIKQKTGMTFMEYLLKTRISKAKEYLLNDNIPIKEIAEKVGYVNYHSFMRIFNKYVGISPSEYRNNRSEL